MYLPLPYRCRCGNYRSRREETLVNLAKRLASKVKRNRQKVSLEPMNAFERKIIHTALQGDKTLLPTVKGMNHSVTL